jgi:diguanylate cyclase
MRDLCGATPACRQSRRVTISLGVSMLRPGDDTDALIERADACLDAAKRNGRNRVICEVDPDYAVQAQSEIVRIRRATP